MNRKKQVPSSTAQFHRAVDKGQRYTVGTGTLIRKLIFSWEWIYGAEHEIFKFQNTLYSLQINTSFKEVFNKTFVTMLYQLFTDI